MATVTRYVNPSSTGGNGTTTALSGANAAYASLASAISSEKAAFDGGSDSYLIVCAGGADGTLPGIIDWGTSVSKTLEITTDHPDGNKHDGTWDSGYYIDLDSSDNGHAFDLRSDYVTITGIQINFDNYGGNKLAFCFANGTENVLIRDCLVRQTGAKSVAAWDGVGVVVGTESWGVTVENCVFWGFTRAAFRIRASAGFPSAVVAVNNCTIYNCGRTGTSDSGGIWATWNNYGTFTLTVNNTIAGATTNGDDYDLNGSATASGANNAASDTTGVGTSPQNSLTMSAQFTDPANGDFTVKDSSADIYEGGSSGTATAEDIIGTTRKATPDIGAFELAAAGGGGGFKIGLPLLGVG